MQLLPTDNPPPRLLYSAALEPISGAKETDRSRVKSRLKRAASFGGNGRAIFLGILLGALGVSAAGYVFTRFHPLDLHVEGVRRFLAVRTHKIAEYTSTGGAGSLLQVRLSPDLLRVTAIALGHPRLAIINGNQVAEGDTVTVKGYGGTVSVTLTVLRIKEGRIDLTDGTRIVTTLLPEKPAK
jgi:hypothetical protein